MDASAITILALVLSLLAVGISAVSVLFLLKFSDVSTLHTRVTTTETDLTDLADRVNHWMRRDSVRRTRERPDVPPVVSLDPKADLRRRAAALRGEQ